MPQFGLTPTTYTIAEYCDMLTRNEVIVNRDYQRSDKVWPPAAQSFLIETILLGYPVPKLSLHQITDLKTRKTVREIVDGQQRTKAIRAFYDGKLRLSRTLALQEAAGKTYDELVPELQSAFVAYAVSVDLFTGASPDQIREVFRRINSYTVPLNPEEQRHAVYQGEMKWFVYRVSRDYDEVFLRLGTFSQSQLVRMADAKLISEIIHALLYGMTTTNKRQLDALYRDQEDVVPSSNAIASRFDNAMRTVLAMEELHDGPLMKSYMMYSLLLAIMHVLAPIDTLQTITRVENALQINTDRAEEALSKLAAALSSAKQGGDFESFVKASEQKTNVREQRATRFRCFVEALLVE
jgi:hypothetical protein